jgi:iron transport multicopper oxidase
VPTLYTVLTTRDSASNPAVYGDYTNSFVLEKDHIVQIVVNNLDTGRHPFHLHGHAFQAVHRSDEDAGTFEDENLTSADFPAMPMRRDTLVLEPTGNLVVRFKADNPGKLGMMFYKHKIYISWFSSFVFPLCLARFITYV